MNLIIYTKSCLKCSDSMLWKNIKQFAQDNSILIEERRVALKPEWREQAKSYEIDLPFAVYNGVALSLKEPLEKIL